MFEVIWMLIKFLLVAGPIFLYFGLTLFVLYFGMTFLFAKFTTALKNNTGQAGKQVLVCVVSLVLIYIFLFINLKIDLISIWFAPIDFLAHLAS